MLIPKIPNDLLEDILRAASKDATRGRQRIKNDWIRDARALFDPSERQACHICGQFQATAQAHHIIALADQYDRGFKKPDHDHVWLCPNHHIVIHRFLSGADLGETAVWRLLEGLNRKQVTILHGLLMRSRKGLPPA